MEKVMVTKRRKRCFFCKQLYHKEELTTCVECGNLSHYCRMFIYPDGLVHTDCHKIRVQNRRK